MTGAPESLSHASPLMREQFVFPYAAGTRFVGALHRAGGFELVNRLYSQFPSTTEQILHPEKYLAGEGPIAVAPPVLPPGVERVDDGSFGELQLFGLLQLCVERPAAARAAAGWGGDAYSVGEVEGRGSLVFLNTIWDTADDATEFEAAMSGCYERNAQRYVRRKGRSVSALAGTVPTNADEWHQKFLKLPAGSPRRDPPLDSVRLIPFRTAPTLPSPRIEKDLFTDYRLGIRVRLPVEFTARLDKETLSASRQGSAPGILLIGLSEWVVTTESLARLYADFVGEVAPYFEGRQLDVVENDRVDTPLGRALERTWSVRGTPTLLKVIAIPICRGTGAIVVTSVWSDERTRRELEWAIQGMRPRTAGEPPICLDLDP
jgi:hypothetical protein